MTSSDLCNYFFESLENQARLGLGPDRLPESEVPAILYSANEVRLDKINSVIWIPGVGNIQIDVDSKIEGMFQFDWAALVKEDNGDWSVIFGRGNPYIVQNSNGLPLKNGAVIAVPAAMNSNFEEFEVDSLMSGTEEIMIPLKLGRNEPCLCGSGKKFKKCCLQ